MPARQIEADTVHDPDRDARVVAMRPAISATLRAQIETVIEAALDTAHRLIALLDMADGDSCLEPEESDTTAIEWTGRGAHRFNVGEAA